MLFRSRQADGWFIFKGHIPALIAFVIYLIAGNAEVNRGPFDLPEAESELTAGYHTEYSGMHFGLFYVAEFVNLFIVAGVAATIFLGGWMPLHISGWEGFNAAMDYIPGFVWFFGKAFFVVWLLMWIKWTFANKHHLDVLAAYEAESFQTDKAAGEKSKMPSDQLFEPDNAAVINSFVSSTQDYRLLSYLTRLNYDYDNRYYIAGSFRDRKSVV